MKRFRKRDYSTASLAVKIKRTTAYILVTSYLLLFSGGAYIWGTADSIDRAHIETTLMLTGKDFVDDKRLISFLEDYLGEAPSHQVIVTFSNWGIKNKTNFLALLEKPSSRLLQSS